MDSPARDQAAPASDVQGSPFFNYLCSLSPIKPVKTAHVAQTYSELTFPSAPTVFASPQLGPKRTARRVEQCDRRNVFLELDNNQRYLQTARCAATAAFDTSRSYPLGVENVPPPASNAAVAAAKGLREQANYRAPSPVKNCAGTIESLQTLPAEQTESTVTLENIGLVEDRKVLDVTQRGFRRCLDFQASDSDPAEDPSLADIGLEHSVETVPTGSDAMAEDHDSLIFCSTQESSSSHLDLAMASIIPSASPCSAEALLLHASVEEPVHNLDGRQSGPSAADMLQQSDGAEEMSETPESPRRRRASENSKDGCKRCKCKKSRCLKLYCECFSAGVYCVGSCTCRDCFNNLDHADTVLEARQQIEIRNPIAFAPKVVPASETPPTDREENWKTPASARHKRGCKCKKSMCLKKYCECYQVGVGCSQGCRCEGCKNLYGKKEGPEAEELDLSKLDPMEKDFLDSQAAGKTLSKNLSPMTPYLGKPGQANATISKKKRPVDHMGSPLPSASGSRKQSSKKKLSRQTSSAFSPLSAEGLTKPPAASPRWDGLDDICTLTPLPSHPTRPTPSSVATSGTSHSAAPSSAADVTPSFHLPFPVGMNPFCSPLGLPAWDKTSTGMEDADLLANTPPGLRKLVLQEPPA